MNNNEVIALLKQLGTDYLKFIDPVKIKATPHSPAIKVISLQVYEGEVRVYDQTGCTVWVFVDKAIQDSVVQRLKLLVNDKEKV